MEKRLTEFAQSTFRLEENEGEDKVISLEKAIRVNVRAGMVLHITSFSAVRAILCQFWGTKPAFTLVAPPIPLGWDLVHCGLAKKVIFCNVGGTHIEAFNRAYREKSVELEVWSYAGISQRLLAGALGTGFVSTRSMLGTSVAEENRDDFQVIDDPFGSGKKVGLIRALNPDLTIVHGWAADREGNTILQPGRLEAGSTVDEWGALASKSGVVVTVERLVSTAFIREHAPLVKIPGYRVNSVSVVPLGAHPSSMAGWCGVKEFETYSQDSELLSQHQVAAEKPETLDAWLKKWVLDCPTHEDYLRKLGPARIQALREKATRDVWSDQLPLIVSQVSPTVKYSESEAMAVAASRKIKEKVLENGYRVVLCGMGASALAAYLAYYGLREQGYLVNLMVGIGLFGFAPRPGVAGFRAAKIIANVAWAYDFIIAGENRRSLSVLSAGQIDRFGNINSGRISDKLFLEGPGGSGDAFQACETVAVVPQSKSRFLEKVSYVTVPGSRVKTLVSTFGIFEKLGDDEEFSLTACLPDPKLPTLKEKIEKVRESCGWKLKTAPEVEEITAPTFEELMTLRFLNPNALSLR